ncbi:Uncharacterised protein [Mycobacterium tuberculosis]|nr:Uncharacterised protein [Mycobacterium tuberculosis]
MVAVSPLATPSSTIAALTVGRYSEARVLTSCSIISIATSGVSWLTRGPAATVHAVIGSGRGSGAA